MSNRTPFATIVSFALLWGAAAPRFAHAQATDVDFIHVRAARIGCLAIQHDNNLTDLVADACDGTRTCAYKAPTPAEYRAAGVTARTRTFCTQGMEITYDCGRDDERTAFVPGDAWTKPPARLECCDRP